MPSWRLHAWRHTCPLSKWSPPSAWLLPMQYHNLLRHRGFDNIGNQRATCLDLNEQRVGHSYPTLLKFFDRLLILSFIFLNVSAAWSKLSRFFLINWRLKSIKLLPIPCSLLWPQRSWFSGKIIASHAMASGSIPEGRILFSPVRSMLGGSSHTTTTRVSLPLRECPIQLPVSAAHLFSLFCLLSIYYEKTKVSVYW